MCLYHAPDPLESEVEKFPLEVGAQSGGVTVGLVLRRILAELLRTVLPSVIIALLITHFVGQRTHVRGSSMEPNLHRDQSLIVEKVSYLFREPKRGDVVTIEVEGVREHLIKRVIGLAGERLEIRENRVYIDRQPLEEPYLANVTQRDYGPIMIAPLHAFVMGDNRGASNDSRSIGTIEIQRIQGRAWMSIWPLEAMGLVK